MNLDLNNELSQELHYVRMLLTQMVIQNCQTSNGTLFSQFIGYHAESMAYLGKIGAIEITNDDGKRLVEGKALPLEMQAEAWKRKLSKEDLEEL